MKLSKQSIVADKSAWEAKGYKLPTYDLEQVKQNTLKAPTWIHFGAGNIFRAFQANLLNTMLCKGETDKGLIVAEGYDYEIIDAAYKKFDDLGIYVELKGDGSIEKTIVGSVVDAYKVDPSSPDYDTLKNIFRNPSLQMVTFTITEKGYSLVDGKGATVPGVAADMKAGPAKADSYMGKVTALLYERFEAGELPIAMVSTDNCSHNGDKLKAAVTTIAAEWVKNGVCDKKFSEYLQSGKVSFPWSMIDKITPRPDDSVKKILVDDGVEDMEATITSKNTYVAPFVNAEETEYLVIEDDFPNGRPQLEKAGVYFTDRQTVDKVEKMKVCTCLNPLHTALAIYGCLLGYKKISDEMKDADLVGLIKTIGYKEGLPVVINPGILDPKKFIDTVIDVRVPNPFMPDTPQRIATDTSQKLAIRYGETVKAYMASSSLDVKDLKLIPLVYAGWCRYLMGVDDAGEKFELSSDPMLDKVCPMLAGVKLGESCDVHKTLQPILSDKTIWGIDLYEAGLGELTEKYFTELISSKNSVRNTLHKYVV